MTLEPGCQSLDVRLRRRGVLVLATFAIIWAMAGSTGVSNLTLGRALFAAACAVALVVAAPAIRTQWLRAGARSRQLPDDWGRRINQVVLAELVGIGVAVAVCLALSAGSVIPAAVCLVVGAHFVPLARIFDQPQYRWTGAGLLLLGLAGLLTAGLGHQPVAAAIVGFGAALVMSATALHVALRG